MAKSPILRVSLPTATMQLKRARIRSQAPPRGHRAIAVGNVGRMKNVSAQRIPAPILVFVSKSRIRILSTLGWSSSRPKSVLSAAPNCGHLLTVLRGRNRRDWWARFLTKNVVLSMWTTTTAFIRQVYLFGARGAPP